MPGGLLLKRGLLLKGGLLCQFIRYFDVFPKPVVATIAPSCYYPAWAATIPHFPAQTLGMASTPSLWPQHHRGKLRGCSRIDSSTYKRYEVLQGLTIIPSAPGPTLLLHDTRRPLKTVRARLV
jgi:hypothetical protein